MDAKDLRDLVHFSDEGPSREILYESEHVWSEVVCLQGTQGIGPIQDHDADAICTIVAGTVAVQVDRGRKRLPQWGTILIPAGSSLTVKNASDEPSVILLVAAPPPTPGAVTG